MKKYPAKELNWFLEDETLFAVLKDFTHPPGARRHYTVYEHGDNRVFVKSFIEKGVSGHIRQLVSPRGKKEFLIARGLKALSIPAPKALGYAVGGRVSAIAEGFIEGKSLLELIKEGAGRKGLLRSLADFLLLLKDKKVRHDDLHLDNVLVSEGTLHLVDLHKVKLMHAFTGEDEITNLTHALGIIYYDISLQERDAFFDRYGCNPETRKSTEDAIERLRSRWVTNKMGRAFRETSVVSREGSELFIKGREDRIRGGYVATLKEDRKVKVERFEGHVRKTYLRRGRFRTAWENHVAMEYLNMPVVPAALHAFMSTAGGNSYIDMEDLHDRGEELDRYLDRNYDSMNKGRRKVFVDTLASFFLTSMTWGITHRDLKACNIFVLDSGGFLLLDVEDIRFSKATQETLRRAFCQLNNTIPKRVSLTDRARFYLRLVSLIDADKKKLFMEIAATSLKEPIVYEGVEGLVTERW